MSIVAIFSKIVRTGNNLCDFLDEDGWMDGLRFIILFKSISVISGQ